MIDHSLLLKSLAERFPEVIEAIDEYESGLLHCEVAVLRRAMEKAMDEGRFWEVERYSGFVEQVLTDADPAVENAIEVSFIEDFALGEFTKQRHRAVRERMPKSLRDKIAAISEHWR